MESHSVLIVPCAEDGELTSVGSSTVSRSSPLKSNSQEVIDYLIFSWISCRSFLHFSSPLVAPSFLKTSAARVKPQTLPPRIWNLDTKTWPADTSRDRSSVDCLLRTTWRVQCERAHHRTCLGRKKSSPGTGGYRTADHASRKRTQSLGLSRGGRLPSSSHPWSSISHQGANKIDRPGIDCLYPGGD